LTAGMPAMRGWFICYLQCHKLMNSVGTAGSSLHGSGGMNTPVSSTAVLSVAAVSRSPATHPASLLAAGFAHSSTVESAGKWQRLYPDKTEFTQICSEKYPTYVVGNYKSKKICFFITMAYNSHSLINRINTGFAGHCGRRAIHIVNISCRNATKTFTLAVSRRVGW